MRVLNVYQLMWGIERYVVSGAVAGLRAVVWHDDGAAYTDGSTIHLPRPNAMWSDEELMLWRYKAEHELGHEDSVNSSPHWKEVMAEKKKDARYKDDGLLWWISNLISDHVQEKNRIGWAVGRDEVLLEGRANFLSTEVFCDKEVTKPDGLEQEIALGLFLWDTRERMKWNAHISPPVKMPAKSEEFCTRIVSESGVKLEVINNEAQVFEAALKVRKLFPEVPASNNFMNALGEGEGKAGGEGKEGKAGSKEGEGKNKKGKKTDVAPPFIPNGTHRVGKRDHRDYSYTKGSGVYVARHGTPLAKHSGRYGGDVGPSGAHTNAVLSLLRRTNLPARVRSYLMAMQREKYTTGWRSGRLDTSRLSDVLRGKEDLFRRKEPTILVDSAVSLLVDSSGSMGGGPFEHACASAIMLAEALQGVKVSVEVAGFTEFGDKDTDLIHDVWVPFGSRFVRETCLDKMSRMRNCLCNNVDGENILLAYSRLKQQKQSRKILIVLSDGEPAGSGPTGCTIGPGQFCKNVCEQIEKDRDVLLVGLGMSGYSPSEFYKNAYEVKHGQALEPVLLQIVQDAVLRR